MNLTKYLKINVKIRPFFLVLALLFIVLFIIGKTVQFQGNKFSQLYSRIFIILSEDYNLEYDSFTTLRDGRDINFMNYMAGPGKYLSKNQLKEIIEVLEQNKPVEEGILKSIILIRKDPEREADLESWIDSHSTHFLEEQPIGNLKQ